MKDIAAIVYDQGTRTIHLFGDSFSLVDLAAALEDVANRLSTALLPMQAQTDGREQDSR